MYTVGAQVVKALSGVGFIDFVKDRILAPLNMTQTTYSVHEALGSGQASETWTSFGRRIPLWMEGVHAETIAGPGGIISNVNDLVRTWRANRNKEGTDGGQSMTDKVVLGKTAFERWHTRSCHERDRRHIAGRP
jgi:CubicO group peptidase (beta-lactamase class C family)